MTNKEAIRVLQEIKDHPSMSVELSEEYEALDLAIKALEKIDDINHKVYRNEWCANKGRCIDYIGYHCAGCIKENKE